MINKKASGQQIVNKIHHRIITNKTLMTNYFVTTVTNGLPKKEVGFSNEFNRGKNELLYSEQ